MRYNHKRVIKEREAPTLSELDNASSPIKAKHRQGLVKVFSLAIAAVVLFGSGLVIGRGDVSFGGPKPLPSNAGLTTRLDYSSVNELYQILKNRYDGKLTNAQLVDGLKTGLVEATGDPYTEYFNPKEAKAFNDELNGSFTGIGAELGTNADKNIVIVSPLSGYPADKAGLKPKDIIAVINGKSTEGISLTQAVRLIRGPAGTEVKLTILRGSERLDLKIIRAQITFPSVEYSIEGDVGYLKVSQFNSTTVQLATKAAQQFKNKGVKGIILDLRSNPGGYLQGSIDIAGLWLDKGQVVVQERRGSTVVGTDYAKGNNLLKGLPTAVLINEGSASASEITAGALRDNKAATLVGTKTFGKGSIQQVEKLPDGSELKVTIARWYTPKGVNIDKQGIKPDITVTLSDEDVKTERDPQKDKAFQIIQQKP